MDTLRDYLNPERIYTDGLHDVGVSNLESTTDNEIVINPTVKESLAVRTAKSSEPAPIRENLTTESAESAEKRRVGEPGYPTANGRQVKNGTAVEEIASDDLDLQVGTAGESSEVEALDWFRQELTALYLWAKDPCLVEPLTLYELEHAEAIASYFWRRFKRLPNPELKLCQTAERKRAKVRNARGAARDELAGSASSSGCAHATGNANGCRSRRTGRKRLSTARCAERNWRHPHENI